MISRNALSRRAALAAIFAVGFQCVAPGRARDDEPAIATPAPTSWESLSAGEQKTLGRFRERWNSLEPAQQQRLLRGTRRWAAMSPAERQKAQERFSRWKDLSADQRELARKRWHRYQQ